jgi:hypothetical protein
MRKDLPSQLERGRCQPDDFVETRPGDHHGLFELVGPLSVWVRMISSGIDTDYGWEHVSVTVKAKRCPVWEEMVWVKNLFWAEDEVVMQLHPAASEYVNEHPFCLHLWRPLNATIPTPPSILVGGT